MSLCFNSIINVTYDCYDIWKGWWLSHICHFQRIKICLKRSYMYLCKWWMEIDLEKIKEPNICPDLLPWMVIEFQWHRWHPNLSLVENRYIDTTTCIQPPGGDSRDVTFCVDTWCRAKHTQLLSGSQHISKPPQGWDIRSWRERSGHGLVCPILLSKNVGNINVFAIIFITTRHWYTTFYQRIMYFKRCKVLIKCWSN